MKIPFSPPYIDANVINEVVDSLKSGWITTGPKVKALEEEIGKISGVKNVLCINSWTSGAILMLRWLGLQPGERGHCSCIYIFCHCHGCIMGWW